jgi:hypothetical protein
VTEAADRRHSIRCSPANTHSHSYAEHACSRLRRACLLPLMPSMPARASPLQPWPQPPPRQTLPTAPPLQPPRAPLSRAEEHAQHTHSAPYLLADWSFRVAAEQHLGT